VRADDVVERRGGSADRAVVLRHHTSVRGFRGDFAVALDRAAAFCRVQASGATHVADDYEATEPRRASELTTRALRLSSFAQDLSASAGPWRIDGLV